MGLFTPPQALLGLINTWTAQQIINVPSGFVGNLLDLKVGGSSKLSIDHFGQLAGGAGGIGYTNFDIGRQGAEIKVANDFAFAWSSTSTAGATSDLTLFRDAPNTHAWRRGTNAQVGNLYDTWASSTDYHRLALKTARATLSGVTGAAVTATGLIPDGAVVVGVTTKVTTALGVSGGTTGYTVGDGSDVDRWGAIVGTAAGTSSDNRDWTATTVQAFIAANNVVITASGGNFDGTGVIYVSVQYLVGEVD